MPREEIRVTIPAQVLPEHTEYRVKITCHGCGKLLTDEEGEPLLDHANELVIYLNEGACSAPVRLRDYCNTCLEPIWDGISKLIGANPHVEQEEHDAH